MRDPTMHDMFAFLTELACDEIHEEHDVDREEAIYWFAANYHGGQSSNLYEALSQSRYSPGPCSSGPAEGLAQDFYDALELYYIGRAS